MVGSPIRRARREAAALATLEVDLRDPLAAPAVIPCEEVAYPRGRPSL
jgi:hypothetical protein